MSHNCKDQLEPTPRVMSNHCNHTKICASKTAFYYSEKWWFKGLETNLFYIIRKRREKNVRKRERESVKIERWEEGENREDKSERKWINIISE